MMNTCRRGLFQGWWWPVGPKLVFDQMAAVVPKIMDGSLYTIQAIFNMMMQIISNLQ
jgi:hypothetical protein